MVTFSSNLAKVSGSATAQIFAEAKELEDQGKDILHFEIGQPDFLPPEFVFDATHKALNEGKVQYTVSKGIGPLRSSVAKYYGQYDRFDADSEVVITSGGKLGIFAALWSVLDAGDNAIILNPSWVSYADIIVSLGADARFVPVDSSFQFEEDKLRNQIDARTRAVILNSPSNPTGSIINRESLQKLVEICLEHDLLLISDEMYNEYVYEGEFVSLAQIKNWKEIGVIVNGMSKTFSMTGFRLGYTLSEKNRAKEINKVMQLTSSCATNFAQHAAVQALEKIEEMRKIIKKIMVPRRKLVLEHLEQIPALEYFPPQGAIYAWMKLPNEIDSFRWARDLLHSEGVAITPGRAFGPAGESHFRFSYAIEEDKIIEGFNRIKRFLN